MHEFSLAQGLCKELEHLCEKHGASAVKEVFVQIGALSGVVPESFRFGFEVLKEENKVLKGAILHLDVQYPSYRCSNCGNLLKESGVVPVACPVCGGENFFPLGGDDLKLMKVELDIEDQEGLEGEENYV